MSEPELLERLTVRSDVFGGAAIGRHMRIAGEHVLGMPAAGDSPETILHEYPVLEPEDMLKNGRRRPAAGHDVVLCHRPPSHRGF